MKSIRVLIICGLLLLGYTSCIAKQEHPLSFKYPKHLKGYFSATSYLKNYPIKKGNRSLSPQEKKNLKALFVWAAAYDRKHNAMTYLFPRTCPIWKVLAHEYPGVEYLSLETTYTEDIAYVLIHNLSPNQVLAWRKKEAEKIISAEREKYKAVPGFHFPKKDFDINFRAGEYLSYYPVNDTHKLLSLSEKQQLIQFFKEEEAVSKKQDLLPGGIDSNCPLMELIITNFPEVNKLNHGDSTYDIDEVLKIMIKNTYRP